MDGKTIATLEKKLAEIEKKIKDHKKDGFPVPDRYYITRAQLKTWLNDFRKRS